MRADPGDEVLATPVMPVIAEGLTLLPIAIKKNASISDGLTEQHL